jgi:DUF1680 family protein
METDHIRNTVADWPVDRVQCRPVPLRAVRASGFLGRRIDANLPSLLKGLESPIPRGFEARAAGREPPSYTYRLAADSDLYKWLEGACYAYAYTRDEHLKGEIDRIAGLIVACQHPDGYVNTQVPPNERFDDRIRHELYIAGHFFEAAVAHHRATGEDALLAVAQRWADYLIGEHESGHPYFDAEPGAFREHPEYELALVRLGRETGEERYLRFAEALTRLSVVAPRLADVKAGGGLHAVRVGYLLAGCAELYLETGDEAFYQHLPALWDEIVRTRLYVTGGIGVIEQIPAWPYVLPQSVDYHPDRDIAETCASVATIMFSWRLHAIAGQSRFYDAIERILYNHYLGAIALNNLGNFYYNPLRVVGDQSGMTDHHGPKAGRCMLPAIHSTSCCMPNAWRFFGALPEYLYSYDAQGLLVNLYTAGTVRHTLDDGTPVALRIETDYPHQGTVVAHVENDVPAEFSLRLRIPEWCEGATVQVSEAEPEKAESGCYVTIQRVWQPGQAVTLNLPMPVRAIRSDPRIVDNAGQVALARGPLIYCLEDHDVDFPVERARLAVAPEDLARAVEVRWEPDLLGGVHTLHVSGLVAPAGDDQPYFDAAPAGEPVQLTLIPFYARASRGDDNRWVTLLPEG